MIFFFLTPMETIVFISKMEEWKAVIHAPPKKKEKEKGGDRQLECL
jgi:hypothetical protein